MAKKGMVTKEHVKYKKHKKRRLVKYLAAYAAIRTGVKTAGKLIDKYNEGPEIMGDSDVLNYSIAFNGRDVKLDNEPFNGATINTICGGLKLDLSNAVIEDDVNIFCKSTLGGVSIVVPENVKVDISSNSKLSAVTNNVPGNNDDTVPTIHIHTENLLSGIDVKAKKEMKNKVYSAEIKTETIDIE